MFIDDIQEGKLYNYCPAYGKDWHKVRVLKRYSDKVCFIVEDETVTNGLRMDFNQIECERYIKEIYNEHSEITDGKTRINLSDVYARLIENNLSDTERFLLAKMVKTIAINANCKNPVIIFDNNNYIDLEVKETRENF